MDADLVPVEIVTVEHYPVFMVETRLVGVYEPRAISRDLLERYQFAARAWQQVQRELAEIVGPCCDQHETRELPMDLGPHW